MTSQVGSGKVKVYTPSRTAKAERDIKLLIKNAMIDWKVSIIEQPVHLQIIFYFKGKNHDYHTKSPDLDNLCKLVCDAGNKVLYTDDKLVVQINAIKRYNPDKSGIFLAVYKVSDEN